MEKKIEKNYSVEMNKHILLLFLTFGIYLLYWIHKTTEKLNDIAGRKNREATAQVLLCMFIPFYFFFWMYETAQRVDIIAAENNVQSDLSTYCLTLVYFPSMPLLAQDKLNKISLSKNGTFTPSGFNSANANNGSAFSADELPEI